MASSLTRTARSTLCKMFHRCVAHSTPREGCPAVSYDVERPGADVFVVLGISTSLDEMSRGRETNTRLNSFMLLSVDVELQVLR